MPPKFYSPADQELYKNYQYLPQEKYRLGLTLPTDTGNDVVTDEGIVNTDAFADTGGGGDFNPAGNMFGEGTAVSPVYGNTYIDIVKKDGPDSQQAVEALINAGGTYPAGLHSAEGGLEYTSDFGNNLDYSKDAFDSLESEDEKLGFLSKMFNKAGQIKSKLPSWAQAGIAALNPFSVIPTILGNIGGDGPQYGIGGLTDQQKAMYDGLASAGYLFNTPSGMKTYDGKNFSQFDQESIDKYFDSKIDKFGSIEEYEDYLDAGGKKKDKTNVKNLIKILDFYKEAQKINDDYEELNTTTTTDGSGDYDDNNQTNTDPVGPQFEDQSYADPGVDAEENQPGNGDGQGQNQGNNNSGGTSATDSGLGNLGFSDIRLKENVELIGKSPSNINIYKFNYKDSPTTYQGAMAHEVPWASVQHSNGYMMIDYSKIDVKLKKI